MTAPLGGIFVVIGGTGFPVSVIAAPYIRQAANLWQYKQWLHQRLIQALGADQQNLYLMDGFLMPVCGFKRAPQARVFQGSARFGRSATKLGTFYGFRGHLLISAQGAVPGLAATPANVDERDIVPERVIGLDRR